MNTSEKIASVVAQFIAADREEDRKRIAELERDLARALVREREANERTGAAIHRVQSLENGAEWERKDVSATIAALNKQLDELNEKCAALVLEKELARGELTKLRSYAVEHGRLPAAPSMRIDTDMSDPQPGKLLVVRLDVGDVRCLQIQTSQMLTKRDQIVGFLVETPAVKQEEQGPWVVYDDPDNLQVNPYMGLHGWGKISDGLGPFDVRSDAVAALNGWVMGGFSRTPRVITLAEARAIEAKR